MRRGWTFRALVAAVVLACAAGAFTLLSRPDGTGPALAQSTATSEDQMADIAPETYAPALSLRFPDAPDVVRSAAMTIMAGGVPALDDLTPALLNASFSQPFPDTLPHYGHTLLRETLISANPDAAEALIAAGADTTFNHNEMPYLGVRILTGERNLAFPDFSQGNRFLTMWLDAGGDPNHRNPDDDSLPLLLLNVPNLNLEAMMILLTAGADPWLTVVKSTTSDGTELRSRSFVEMNASANPAACEVIFRLSEAGLIPLGPADDMAAVAEAYDLAASEYVDGTGPEASLIGWHLQMAMESLSRATGLTYSGDAARLLETPRTERQARTSGGFWLAPDEIRSPPVEEQLVTPERQFGTETWDG